MNSNFSKTLVVVLFLISFFKLDAQESSDTVKKYLYRPHNNTIVQKQVPDTLNSIHNLAQDSSSVNQDSLIARQQFIRDSILRQKKIVDSLNNIKNNLPKLLEAGIWMQAEQLIVNYNSIDLIGDSSLSNYSYTILPLSFNLPYTPWNISIPLNSKTIVVDNNDSRYRIAQIKTSKLNWSFSYTKNPNILVVNEQSIVVTKNGKNFYKIPFDSIFFAPNGKIAKIKRYAHLHQSNASYQKGNYLFTYLYEIKQFGYSSDLSLTYFEVDNFCERWSLTDASKVCNIARYSISKQNNTFTIVKQNDPANDYADGNFLYEFDNANNLKVVSFKNKKNTDSWKTTIELNDKGYVYRYIYEVNGKTNNTLLFNYFLNDPKAKCKYEAISCTFEDDGISYFQKNLTTGKSRIRDHFTAEWGAWQ
jgi:hypothetical protein